MKIILKADNYIVQLFSIILLANTLTSCNSNRKSDTIVSTERDSVALLIKQSKNSSNSLERRRESLAKAYIFNDSFLNDSLKISNLSKIAYQAYRLKDSSLFKKVNLEAYNLSVRLQDTFSIADIHWNYAMYYVKYEINDSSFYHFHKAYEYFESIHKEYLAGRMLYNMAVVQKDVRDFTGSEITVYQAISKFKKLNKQKYLYLCYNLLGVVFNELTEYEKSVLYHQKAIKNLEKLDDKKNYVELSFNNLGLVYQQKGDYKGAIAYYKKALKRENLKSENIRLYARLVDNLAYTKFLNGDKTSFEQEYFESLRIRDSLNIPSGIIISKLHLAKFYATYDTVKAVLKAEEAYTLAVKVSNNRDALASLILLSKLDTLNSKEYLNNYILLLDSLEIKEQKIRNKFTRIRFETDEYVEEAEKLSYQKRLISFGSFALFLIFSLLYYIKVQRTKTKELLFEKEQQKSDEKIYSLLLKQQSKLEEGRLSERNRIAEDLHDGILGKIFGIRLGLGFLSIKGDKETLEKHHLFIDELQHIEKDIRVISHELKNDKFSSDQDYISIVENSLTNISEIGQFQFTLSNDDTIHWNKVDEIIKMNCYRIIQEGLLNIQKYAKATLVHINFTLTDGVLKLKIKDNGVGFDVKKNSKGIGLINIQDRAHKINGKFTIDSKINDGTELTFLIPL